MAFGISAWGGGGGGLGPWGGCVPGLTAGTHPTISLQSPAPNATGVLSTADIAFRVSDDVGVDFGTIKINIQVGSIDQTVFVNGSFLPGFMGPNTFVSANNSNGFDFIIDTATPWVAGSQVTVTVSVGDESCNVTTVSWKFSVAQDVAVCCQPFSSLTIQHLGGWGDHEWGSSYWGGGLNESITIDVGGGIPVFDSISPSTGLTTGGTQFVIIGTNLSTTFFNDNFMSGKIGPLWDLMGGSITEGPIGFDGHLDCNNNGSYQTYCGLIAKLLKPFGDFHVEVSYQVKSDFKTNKAPVEVTLAAIEAAFDSGNFIRFSHVAKGGTSLLRAEVWKSGTLRHIQESPTAALSGTLGIMRYYDSVSADNRAGFWYNGVEVFDTHDCPDAQMTIRFFTFNSTSNYSIDTWFDTFISHTVVTFTGQFGAAPARGVIEASSGRIRGITPPTQENWAGAVSLRITNGSGSGCSGVCFSSVTPYTPATPSDWQAPAPTTVEDALHRLQLTTLDHFPGVSIAMGACGGEFELAADLALHMNISVSPTLDDMSHKLAEHIQQPIGHPNSLVASGCFVYEYPAGFVVGRQVPFRPTPKEASFLNDPALRNPGPNVGHNLKKQY